MSTTCDCCGAPCSDTTLCADCADAAIDRLRAELATAVRERDEAKHELDSRRADAEAWLGIADEDVRVRDAVYDWARTVTRGTNPFRELGGTVIAQLVRTLSIVVKRDRDRARAVVDAARAWRDDDGGWATRVNLRDAVDAFDAAEKRGT